MGSVETECRSVALVPQLLLFMLPRDGAVDSFPDWLDPFVRYQPVSEVTQTLRGFTSGHVAVSNLVASVAWCLGLLVVFGALAVRAQRRTSMSADAMPRSSLAAESLVFAGHLLTRWRRQPGC